MKGWLELSPPLADIERRLFGVSNGLLRAVETGKVSERIRKAVMASAEWKERGEEEIGAVDVDAKPRAMPAHLQDLIRRRVAADQAKFGPIPLTGQIVELTEVKTPRPGQLDWVMQVPLFVLLDAPAESSQIWHGWLVSGETDYATSWDFVLQEQDAPFDPDAGMVQVWNPVRVYLPMASRVVAQLRPERLQAVRSLAADFICSEEPSEPARPGRVAVRSTSAGLSVATGSPVGGIDDPRRSYQRIYHYAAEAVREPARLTIAELEPATSIIESIIKGLLAAASKAGDSLIPVPRVEIAMGTRTRNVDALYSPPAFFSLRRELSVEDRQPPGTWGGIPDATRDLSGAISSAIDGLGAMVDLLHREQERLAPLRSLLSESRTQSARPAPYKGRSDEVQFGVPSPETERQRDTLREQIANSAKAIARIGEAVAEMRAHLSGQLSGLEREAEAGSAAAMELRDLEAEREDRGQEAIDLDLAWHDIARIRIAHVTPEGAGSLLVFPGTQRVTARVEVAGSVTDKVIVEPGAEPGQVAWEAEGTVKLILGADDGRMIELPLYPQP